jgi:hypothetical protein
LYRDVDIHALDYDTHRILPLLYRNLLALGIESPELPRLKGVYRHYWYSNQLLLRDAKLVLQALGDSGIDTLVLKGLALGAAYYGDGGTRPMYDIDVLVRPGDASRAVCVLADLGYARQGSRPLAVEQRTRHSAELKNDAGRDLDLHWYALFTSTDDRDLWRDSVPITVAGVQTRALCPSDQLLHACVHGVFLYPAPMRWLADAATVIRTTNGQFDWELLVDRAISRRCTVALVDALTGLEQHLGVGVPASVVQRLGTAPASASERLAHRAAARPYAQLNYVALEWDRYRRLRAARAPGVQPHFAAYVLDRWNFRNVPRVLGRKIAEAVRQRRAAGQN